MMLAWHAVVCLSLIKVGDRRYLNVKPRMFFYSYQDNCLIGICWLESHENKSEGLRCRWITETRFFFCDAYRSYPNPSVLSMQITRRRADIHSPARLWLDMKLSCCLHQLWLRGLSGLCSDAAWEWRRYSNKAIWANWSWIRYTVCVPFIAWRFRHPDALNVNSGELREP